LSNGSKPGIFSEERPKSIKFSSTAATFGALDGSLLSLDRAVEFAGGHARMYVGEEAVFVGEAEAATITRYEVSPLGALEAGASMSLNPLGASPGNVNVFVSPEQAYLVDQWGPTGLQLIKWKWNPREMATIGTIDVAEVASDEYVDFDVQMALRWGVARLRSAQGGRQRLACAEWVARGAHLSRKNACAMLRVKLHEQAERPKKGARAKK
jgi:hypothetical protein